MIRERRPLRSPLRARFLPTLDRLEGRTLMAFSGGLDPTFGGGSGYSLTPVSTGSNGQDMGVVGFAQVQVESDGSIVEARFVNNSTAIGVIRLNADGTRVTTFGTSGEADVANSEATGIRLLVQSDGKILVVGLPPGNLSPSPTTLVVARLNADGSPDASYGTAGVATLDLISLGIEPGGYFGQTALQADDTLVVVGNSPIPSHPSSFQVVAARLGTSGALDPTFGTGGVATFSDIPAGDLTNANPPTEVVEGLAIQPGGRIVITANIVTAIPGSSSVATPVLIGLNTDGSRDLSLSEAGIGAAGFTAVYSLAAESNGDLIVVGFASTASTPKSGLARLKPDGSLDLASFTAPVNPSIEIAVAPDGKILVAAPGRDLNPSNQITRLNTQLVLDDTFGMGGVAPAYPAAVGQGFALQSFAVGPDGRVVAVGLNAINGPRTYVPPTMLLISRLLANGTSAHSGDLDGDGVSDPTIYLPNFGAFAIAYSSGVPSQLIPFGGPGLGTTIPAVGNYDATGKQEIGAYIPVLGLYAYRPPTGPDVYLHLGTPGPGLSIPAPGDYYGTGQDDVAVYLADLGAFAIVDPTGKTPGEIIPFGSAGVGASIPAPGDYFGTGHDDLAVYLPAAGAFAIADPAGKVPAELVPFGGPGLGTALPMPGDYDGSGRTELAVYLPALGELVYRPAAGGNDVTIPFGGPGVGTVLPMQGDYSGSGRTEPGVYIPALGELVYRPPTGPDVQFPFGSPGPGQTIPATRTVLFASEVIPGPGPGASSGGTVYALSVPGGPDGLEALAFPTAASAVKKAKLASWETPALV